MNRWSLAGVAGALLMVCGAGCGSDESAGERGPDVGGLYEVTRHTFGTGDCLVEGADATGLAYIRLTPEDHQGTPYFALRRCDSMDATDCDDLDFTFGTSFIVPMDAGWEEIKASAAFQPSLQECWLMYGRSTVIRNGAGVIVQLRTYQERDPALSAAECLYEVAFERTDSMPCAEHEVIYGMSPAQ